MFDYLMVDGMSEADKQKAIQTNLEVVLRQIAREIREIKQRLDRLEVSKK